MIQALIAIFIYVRAASLHLLNGVVERHSHDPSWRHVGMTLSSLISAPFQLDCRYSARHFLHSIHPARWDRRCAMTSVLLASRAL